MNEGLVNYYWDQIWILWNDRKNPETLSKIVTYLNRIQIHSSNASTKAEVEKTKRLLQAEQNNLSKKQMNKASSLATPRQSNEEKSELHQVKAKTTNEKEDTHFLYVEKPGVNFSQVAGLEQTKLELRRTLEWPLRFNKLMKDFGLEPSKGILLFGPPGCGKTHLARCSAGEFDVNFVLANPSNIGSKWYGQAEKNVSKCFETARKYAPSILFIDEVDKLLRHQSGSSVAPRVLGEFEIHMDGFEKHPEQVVVLMGSNEPWRLHSALIRKGRIDRIVFIRPPDEKAREQVFRLNLNSAPINNEIEFSQLALSTAPNEEGFYYSCSDIKEICRTAKEEAVAETLESGSRTPIGARHIERGFEKVPPSISPTHLKKFIKWAQERASLIE